jgi:hypothetical protein
LNGSSNGNGNGNYFEYGADNADHDNEIDLQEQELAAKVIQVRSF